MVGIQNDRNLNSSFPTTKVDLWTALGLATPPWARPNPTSHLRSVRCSQPPEGCNKLTGPIWCATKSGSRTAIALPSKNGPFVNHSVLGAFHFDQLPAFKGAQLLTSPKMAWSKCHNEKNGPLEPVTPQPNMRNPNFLTHFSPGFFKTRPQFTGRDGDFHGLLSFESEAQLTSSGFQKPTVGEVHNWVGTSSLVQSSLDASFCTCNKAALGSGWQASSPSVWTVLFVGKAHLFKGCPTPIHKSRF